MRRPILTTFCFLSAASAAYADDIEHVVVHSDFRDQVQTEVPASVSIIDDQAIADSGASHFEDLLSRVSNLSWAGGTARPRYFQIRGVGETEDYTGRPTSSVGFVVDDIDLSGLGMAASLYDLQQVEVLRGPQGTRFGASAMAGLIYLSSKDPVADTTAGVEGTLGNDDLTEVAGYASGAIAGNRDLLYRVAIQQHNQNGFIDDAYLHHDDTNQRDELTVRGKLSWQIAPDVAARLTYIHADIDDGYDAWTLDNNGFTTLSDQPGVDTQRTDGAALRVTAELPAATLVSITSGTDTRHRNAYDGDWANPDYWSARSCTDDYDSDGDGATDDWVPCEYSYWWDKTANRQTLAQELRLLSNDNSRLFGGSSDWLLGVWGQRISESTHLESTYNGYPDEMRNSDYDVQAVAVFAQIDSALTDHVVVSGGLRVERRHSDYDDDHDEHFNPSENLWGGHLALRYLLDDGQEGYLKVARGYKAGGFNMDLGDSFATHRTFDGEVMYNTELGFKGFVPDSGLSGNIALFYMIREDQQVNASIQDPDNPQRFVIYTDNAARSTSYGLEADGQWRVSTQWTVYGNLGLLETRFDDYQAAQSDGTFIDQNGRELAHAPNWQYALGTTWRPQERWFANLQLNGSDGYYYSDDHDQKADGHTTLDARIGYEAAQWAVYLWGRNLTDKKYSVRGFYFGNEPDNGWADKLYERYADPRTFGVTVRYQFL